MVVAALLLIVGAQGGTAQANPLLRAEKGELQCYRPDLGRKTCQSIAAYRRTGPLAYDNKALVPLSSDATLETHTPVVIKGDSVCGSIAARDVTSGTLRVAGRVLPADAARSTLERIAQNLAPLADKEICTRYEGSGADLTAKVSIAGAYRADQDQSVRWIGPDDGYTVAP